MKAPGDVVRIDLAAVRTSKDLLASLGAALELGGPGGNIPVSDPTAGLGWGLNWDALLDSLTQLDTGGIWGTSKPLGFPLRLELVNAAQLQANDAYAFNTLSEILQEVSELYAAEGLEFEYEIS